MKKPGKIKLTPLLRAYLKPLFGWKTRPLKRADWADFRIRYGPQCRRRGQRHRRKVIKKYSGKWPEQLTFEEFMDYQKPNSSAPHYLKELWPQLTPAEQEVVKNLNEWAFMFPATFDTKRQFLVACAFRLRRFFGRDFHPKKARTKTIELGDAEFGKLAEGAMFER
jgi:hypothetical protein